MSLIEFSKIWEIRKQLQKIAKEFNLKYKPEIFNFYLVSMEEKLIVNFIDGCPDPEMLKISSTNIAERSKNLKKFTQSKYFKYVSKGTGGTVVTKKDLLKERKSLGLITDKQLMQQTKKLYAKLIKKCESNELVLVAASKNHESWMYTTLLHEWVHILLQDNKIYFQNKNKDYWVYDEGLTTYLTTFSGKEIKRFPEDGSKTKMNKLYHKNALLFYKLLKDKKDPKQRKDIILNFYKNLQ